MISFLAEAIYANVSNFDPSNRWRVQAQRKWSDRLAPGVSMDSKMTMSHSQCSLSDVITSSLSAIGELHADELAFTFHGNLGEGLQNMTKAPHPSGRYLKCVLTLCGFDAHIPPCLFMQRLRSVGESTVLTLTAAWPLLAAAPVTTLSCNH